MRIVCLVSMLLLMAGIELIGHEIRFVGALCVLAGSYGIGTVVWSGK